MFGPKGGTWLDRFTSSEATLFGVGVGLLVLAYPTAAADTYENLPGRSILVMLSLFGGFVGIGAAFFGARHTRTWVGMALIGYSLLRAGAFLLKAVEDSGNPLEIYANSSGAIVWLLIAYIGLLIWVRGHRDPGRRNGE